MEAPESQSTVPAVIPAEGLHVLHLYYRVDYPRWEALSDKQRENARQHLAQVFAGARETPETQLLACAVTTPRADLGFLLVSRDLQVANALEKKLNLSLGAGVLQPVYHYLSLTERSEYLGTTEEAMARIVAEEGLKPGTEPYFERLNALEARMAKYGKDKLYPKLPNWPVICFYPMSKRRGPGANWYALPFEERKRLMAGHGAVGRNWAGRVLQLITASTGLDTHEWGVTLFARDTRDLTQIVYQMRFDEVSALYGEFGDFYVGLQLPLDQLLERLQLA